MVTGDLVENSREHLAVYVVPLAIHFVDDVSKTSTGRIMCRSLKQIDDGARSITEPRRVAADPDL